MRLPRSILRWFFLAAVVATTARAHNPEESWTNCTLLPDGLKVEVTMAQQCALMLLGKGPNLPYATEDNFKDYHDALKTRAPDLYVITSIRTPLKPRTVEVRLTEEMDIEFTLVYPRPAPGRLHFHASFLTKLGEGFGGMIYLTDPAGKDLGWDQISSDTPNFEVTILAAPPEKKAP